MVNVIVERGNQRSASSKGCIRRKPVGQLFRPNPTANPAGVERGRQLLTGGKSPSGFFVSARLAGNRVYNPIRCWYLAVGSSRWGNPRG
jgi:hypothetical protein